MTPGLTIFSLALFGIGLGGVLSDCVRRWRNRG